MAQVCPISSRRIDSNMARMISFQVTLFAMILLVTQDTVFAAVLLFDFSMRTLRLPQYSPFHIIGNFILSGWGIAPKLCDESPKRFALYLGLLASLCIVVFYVAGFTIVATSITAVLFLCALLETVFDYCIGCKIYYAIQIAKGFLNNDRNIQ